MATKEEIERAQEAAHAFLGALGLPVPPLARFRIDLGVPTERPDRAEGRLLVFRPGVGKIAVSAPRAVVISISRPRSALGPLTPPADHPSGFSRAEAEVAALRLAVGVTEAWSKRRFEMERPEEAEESFRFTWNELPGEGVVAIPPNYIAITLERLTLQVLGAIRFEFRHERRKPAAVPEADARRKALAKYGGRGTVSGVRLFERVFDAGRTIELAYAVTVDLPNPEGGSRDIVLVDGDTGELIKE